MSKDQRGDRYWCKKNAVATIALTIRIGSLVGAIQRRGEVSPPVGEGEGAEDTSAGLLDAEVSAAEKEARPLMARFEKRAKAAGRHVPPGLVPHVFPRVGDDAGVDRLD